MNKNIEKIISKITDDDFDRVLEVLSGFNVGELIYSGKISEKLNLDINKTYLILDSIRNSGYLKMIYELRKDGEIKRYSSLSDIPDGSLLDCYVLYKSLVEFNFKESNDCVIEVNNKKFYYNPENIEISEEVMKKLAEFKGEDEIYSFYNDKSQGLVIY